MLRLVAALITFYQKYLSPLSGPTCRFYPSCSQYSKESFERHGLLRGGVYTVIRLMKCHPYHRGGYDPVK
ncbi:membrane protein insertion efficiency factor YidD [Geobacter pickeringii]|uniref:membrane protein insertion efficiency factor YidD n=1 Tax=Geobacter pickeringii TaxID=345632 RepID=UPI0009FD3C5F|nr:membrane protein insertion efficiency factor YidD [Geobacter pickeringii]